MVTSQVHQLPAFYNNNLGSQTYDHVMIANKMIHEARIIRLDRRSTAGDNSPVEGDGIGRWEGPTLVVDTANFTTRPPCADRAQLRCRIARWPETSGISPDRHPAFVQSWSAESVMARTDGRMFEYACHEANYSMTNVLKGGRFSEQQGVQVR